MNRRGFLGSLAALAIAPAVTPAPEQKPLITKGTHKATFDHIDYGVAFEIDSKAFEDGEFARKWQKITATWDPVSERIRISEGWQSR